MKVLSRFLKNTRLPFSVVRGTETQRMQKSRNLSERLYNKLFQESKDKFCTVAELEESVREVLSPYKIEFNIVHNNSTKKKCLGYHSVNISHEIKPDEIILTTTGHEIYLPQRKSDGKVKKFVALHEFGHMFDNLFNQKFTGLTRGTRAIMNPKNSDNSTLIIDTFNFQSKRKISFSDFKYAVRKALERTPNEQAIEELQIIRESLKTEVQQHRYGLRKMLQNPDICPKINIFKYLKLLRSEKFGRKLKFANKLLKELIAKERKIHAESIT